MSLRLRLPFLLVVALAGCSPRYSDHPTGSGASPTGPAAPTTPTLPAPAGRPDTTPDSGVVDLPLVAHPPGRPGGRIVLISRDRTRAMLAARDAKAEDAVFPGLRKTLDEIQKEPDSATAKEAREYGLFGWAEKGPMENQFCAPNTRGAGYWREFRRTYNLPPFPGGAKTFLVNPEPAELRDRGPARVTLLGRTEAAAEADRLGVIEGTAGAVGALADQTIGHTVGRCVVGVALQLLESTVAARRKAILGKVAAYGVVRIVSRWNAEGTEEESWIPNPGYSEEFLRFTIARPTLVPIIL